jgi:hypothetical protein
MAIPTNLIPSNASDISGSFQSLTGEIPTEPVEIPEAAALSVIIPDDLFVNGTIDQIRERTLGKAEQYLRPLAFLPVKKPPFALIKNYIETKIDRIKVQRQKASLKALKEELKLQQNPFQYRQELKNTTDRTNRG